MARIYRKLLSCLLLLGGTLFGCGDNAWAPGGATGGQGGAAGATGDHVDAAGGAGGAGGEIEGGAGDAGGAPPSDGSGGSGGCAGILSFADPNVERAALQVLDAGPLLEEHARHFDYLHIKFTPSEPLKSLSGLECFTGLRRLDISGPDLPSWGLVDLSPIAALKDLNFIDFHFDPAFGRDFGPWPHVLDLSPIAKLTGLRTVRFDINAVQDITAIGSLNVITLFLHSDTLSDLSPLAKVPELGSALIRGKAIRDVAPLAAALKKQGVRLVLINTSVSDISSFATLADIRGMSMNDNLIQDIAPIVNLPTLVNLNVQNNPLDCPTQMPHIQALQARGVTVTHSCP